MSSGTRIRTRHGEFWKRPHSAVFGKLTHLLVRLLRYAVALCPPRQVSWSSPPPTPPLSGFQKSAGQGRRLLNRTSPDLATANALSTTPASATRARGQRWRIRLRGGTAHEKPVEVGWQPVRLIGRRAGHRVLLKAFLHNKYFLACPKHGRSGHQGASCPSACAIGLTTVIRFDRWYKWERSVDLPD